jgi:hypothetical protein
MPNVPNVPGVPALSSYATNNTSLLITDAAIVVGAFLPPPWGIYYQGQPVLLPASIASQLASSALAPFAQVASLLGFPNLLPVFASTLEFDFDQEWAIADTQQEQGAFQSYDKVQLPFDLRTRICCGGAVGPRQAFLNAIFAIAGGSPLGSSSLITSALSSVASAAGLSSIGASLTGGILSGTLTPPLFDIVTPEGTYASCSARRVSFSRRSDEGATLIAVDLWWKQIRQTSTASFSNAQIPGIAGQQSISNVQPQTPNVTFPSGSLM